MLCPRVISCRLRDGPKQARWQDAVFLQVPDEGDRRRRLALCAGASSAALGTLVVDSA